MLALSGELALGGGRTVNRLGFGAMRITGPGIWGEPNDPDEARRVLRRAVELGVNLIDTAHAYGPEVSERLIAEALHPYRDDLVIATKTGLQRSGPNTWHPDASPQTIRRECERSLALLRVETIDLYQLHRPDPKVPLEESLGTIVELQTEGKVRLIGISNVDAEQLRRARAVTEIVSVQNRFNVDDQSSDEVLAACEQDGIAFLPWAPLGVAATRVRGGWRPSRRRTARLRVRSRSAWLLASSPVMLPIPGTSSVAHLEENVAAAGLQLTPDEVARHRPHRGDGMIAVTNHRISRDEVIWAFGPDLDPVLEVEPGDTVTFETNDCFTGQIRSEADLVTEIDFADQRRDRTGRGAGRRARRLARRGDPRRASDRVGRRDADPRLRAARSTRCRRR